MNDYDACLILQQTLGVMRIFRAYEEHRPFQWRKGEIPASQGFRVERIRLGLELRQEEFAEYLQVPLEMIRACEQLPQLPNGTGVMFLKWFVERNKKQGTPPPFHTLDYYRSGQRKLFLPDNALTI